PEGAGPIQFIRDFGDTAALMLTVASPKAKETDIAPRAIAVRRAIENVRAQVGASDHAGRFTIVVNFPQSLGARTVHPALDAFAGFARERGCARDIRLIEGAGFLGLDGATNDDDAALVGYLHQFISERMQSGDLHPDTWEAAVIRDPADTHARIAAVAGDRYSY